LSRRKTTLAPTAVKTLGANCIELSDDATSAVREVCFQVLARMLWLCGERLMGQFMSKLDKIKSEKVNQFVATYGPSNVSSSNNNAGVHKKDPVYAEKKPPAKAPPKKAPSTQSTTSAKPPPKPTMSSTQSTSRPPTRSGAVKKDGNKAKKVAQSVDFESEIESTRMSKEEVVEKASEIIAANIITGLSSPQWKDRVEASMNLENQVKNMGAVLEQNAEVVVRYIGYAPGWSEANVQVITKLLDIVTFILSQIKLSKGAAAGVIDGIVEKLATAKAKESGKACLTAMCDILLPQFVFAQLYKKLNGHKNPKITAEGLSWMTTSIADFGMKHIRSDSLIDFAKNCLTHANPAVKKNCTELLCEMKKFMGDALLDFLSDVKPALLAAIKKEFDKIPNVPPPAPTRQLKGDTSDPSEDAQSGNPADILPRTDIKSRITAKILKNLEDSSWKTRVAAVTEIEQIIAEANKRIQPTLSEVVNSLKKKLDDSYVQVMSAVLRALGLIAIATGPAVEKYCKLVLTNIISKLSHNNKSVRTLAISTLETWVEVITLGPMLKYFSKGMSNEKGHPDGRKDALSFVLKHYPSIDAKLKNIDLFQPIIPVIIESIQDPKPDVRKIAEQILSEIVSVIGAEMIRKHCRDLKPAFRQTVNGIIDKYAPVVELQATQVIQPAQPEASKLILSNTVTAAAAAAIASSDMEIDEETTDEPVTVVPQSFKQPRTVVRRPVLEVNTTEQIPVQPTTVASTGSHTPRLPDRVVPPLIIAELDDTQPISIQKLIASIQVDQINSENSIDALKKMVEILQSDRRAVLPHVKELVETLTISIQKAFEMASSGVITIRICKYLLNTTMILFSQRNLVELIDKETLQNLIHQLLTRLLDEKLPHLDDGQNLLRAFNQLMIYILQNSNRTSTYTALLKLLSHSHDDQSLKRYTELVVKCLLKLTKALQSTLDKLQIDILLMDLHEFLTNNPPTQFKGKDDLPLRTVKTILNELVNVKGTSIRTHLSFIPTHKNPLIVSYIELMLNNAQKQKEKEEEVATTTSSRPVSGSSTNTDDMNNVLDEIFTSIANKDTCNQGLLSLYKFKKTYVDADISNHLAKCSEAFQGYINRQLIKIEQHELRQSQMLTTQSVEQLPPTRVEPVQPVVTSSPHKRNYTLTSMDAIRAEVKRRQQEAAKEQGGVKPTVTRSLSVQDIRRRFREVANDADPVSAQPMSVDPQPLALTNSISSADQLEALKRRIRAKSSKQSAVTNLDDLSNVTQSLDTNALRARLAASQSKSADEEKENQPNREVATMAALKERLARLS
jgi:hypothetical protein